jgi:hypothetical protein
MIVTIANGQSISNAADLQSGHLLGFALPAAFTGATITFQVSVDGLTYQALHTPANAAISFTVTQAKSYGFTADIISEMSNWRYIKFVSVSAEGAARDIALWVR